MRCRFFCAFPVAGTEAPREATHPKHDLGQKNLFSHRHMVADLLRLLSDDLTEGLGLGTLRHLLQLPPPHQRWSIPELAWC